MVGHGVRGNFRRQHFEATFNVLASPSSAHDYGMVGASLSVCGPCGLERSSGALRGRGPSSGHPIVNPTVSALSVPPLGSPFVHGAVCFTRSISSWPYHRPLAVITACSLPLLCSRGVCLPSRAPAQIVLSLAVKSIGSRHRCASSRHRRPRPRQRKCPVAVTAPGDGIRGSGVHGLVRSCRRAFPCLPLPRGIRRHVRSRQHEHRTRRCRCPGGPRAMTIPLRISSAGLAPTPRGAAPPRRVRAMTNSAPHAVHDVALWQSSHCVCHVIAGFIVCPSCGAGCVNSTGQPALDSSIRQCWPSRPAVRRHAACFQCLPRFWSCFGPVPFGSAWSAMLPTAFTTPHNASVMHPCSPWFAGPVADHWLSPVPLTAKLSRALLASRRLPQPPACASAPCHPSFRPPRRLSAKLAPPPPLAPRCQPSWRAGHRCAHGCQPSWRRGRASRKRATGTVRCRQSRVVRAASRSGAAIATVASPPHPWQCRCGLTAKLSSADAQRPTASKAGVGAKMHLLNASCMLLLPFPLPLVQMLGLGHCVPPPSWRAAPWRGGGRPGLPLRVPAPPGLCTGGHAPPGQARALLAGGGLPGAVPPCVSGPSLP